MTLLDYLLIGGILLTLIWAVRVCVRNHIQGKGCAGDCAHCSHSCGK